MRILCSAKDSHIFSTKNKCICNINVGNFNETLTNDVVSFEQLAPGVTDQGIGYIVLCLSFVFMNINGNQVAQN